MNIGSWITVALRIGPLIVGAVQAIERLVTGAKGKDKQDAAVALINTILSSSEAIAGKNLLDDAAVDAAVRAAIDAIVAVENIIALKRAEADASK